MGDDANDLQALRPLVPHVDVLVAIAVSSEERHTFWREFRRLSHWDKGVGGFFKLVVTGFIMAVTAFVIYHYLEQGGGPPSLPPVTVSTPAPHPSPLPSVRP